MELNKVSSEGSPAISAGKVASPVKTAGINP